MKARRCDCSSCRAHDAGHRGPYTPTQLLELSSDRLVEPERPVVAVDPEVARAGEAVDEALEVFEKATARWEKALPSPAERSKGSPDGYVLGSDSQTGKRAERKLAAAREARDEAGEKLRQARARWHQLKQASDQRRYNAAYQADMAEQEAERRRERLRRDELIRDDGR